MGMLSHIKPYEIKTPQQNSQDKKNKDEKLNTSSTLKGVLMNKYRDETKNYEPTSDILITSPSPVSPELDDNNKPEIKSFNMQKALTPILVATVGILGGMAGLSGLLKMSAKAKLQVPDLALNMNIKQEPLFATYMALRNPNAKTIAGAAGVFAMSGITLVFKNLVDGVKEVWIKKRESDIQRDLQEQLIETETKVFSGKLQIERNVLGEAAQYFDKVFNRKPRTSIEIQKVPNAFKSINNFCGKPETETTEIKSKNTKKNTIYGLALLSTAAIGTIMGKFTFKNLKQTTEIVGKYTKEFTENAIELIEKAAERNAPEDVETVSKLFEKICAKPDVIKETLTKMNVSEGEIKKIIDNVEKSKKDIYADAPTTFGGITTKIQYYCYLDEDRGHLYNMIIHPEEPFLRHLFMASSGISAIGYIAKQCADAIKAISVSKENADTELSLQNRLIDVEIKNFKSKKDCAVSPLIEEFNRKQEEGLGEKELQRMADNILVEIKNSAPFVYS